MAAIYLVCEGLGHGLDLRVLDRLVVQRFGLNVSVTPAGGAGSLRSVAAWLEDRDRKIGPDRRLTPPTDRAYTIEDRNYRPLVECERSWRPDSKRLIWRRHEIENYLLDPRVVSIAFAALRASVAKWPSALPESVADIESLLLQLAWPLLENHAGWLTYWYLDRVKQSIGSTRFAWPDDLKPAAGTRYPGRAEWLNYLALESHRARDASGKFVALEAFEAETIRREYDRVFAEVSSPEFFSTGTYLADLGGHELMSALLDYINQLQCPLSLSDFEDQLLISLAQQYVPNFFVPDEFSELTQRLV